MAASNMYYFVIVGKNDNPLYEVEFTDSSKKENSHLGQFIVHSSLDMVDELVWKSSTMYLKEVDRFGELFVSAFVTAGNIRFMILHEQHNDGAIKNFFTEVYELYVKVFLNPFNTPNTPITSPVFDAKVKQVGKKCFNTKYPEK